MVVVGVVVVVVVVVVVGRPPPEDLLEGMSAQGIPWRAEGFTCVAQVGVFSGTSECRGDERNTFGGMRCLCVGFVECALQGSACCWCVPACEEGRPLQVLFPLVTFSGACVVLIYLLLIVFCAGRATAGVAVVMAARRCRRRRFYPYISRILSLLFSREHLGLKPAQAASSCFHLG